MSHDYCPVCGSESKFSFDTKYVKVHNCLNDKCDHYFAVQTKYDQGVCEYNLNKDYSIYNERNKNLIKLWKSVGLINNKIELLDIGTGFGHLLGYMHNSYPKISIAFVEPSKS